MKNDEDDEAVWWKETKRALNLAIPTIVINVGTMLPQAITTSALGRQLGSSYMEGFTLANATANLLNLSVLQGFYMANDTLSPQAFGAKRYKEVGLLSIRGFFVCLCAITPITVMLCLYLEAILIFLGEPPDVAMLAGEFYRVYALGFPLYIVFMMMWKFLAAQEIMIPLLVVIMVNCTVVLPLSLYWFIRWFGYLGAASALVLYQLFAVIALLTYLCWAKPYLPSTWQPCRWREALDSTAVIEYTVLGVGGILSSAEWWFWEILTILVGSFGTTALGIQSIAAQLLQTSAMVSLGMGIALAVQVGATISSNVPRSKQIMLWYFIVSVTLYFLLALAFWKFRHFLFSLFTRDPIILKVS